MQNSPFPAMRPRVAIVAIATMACSALWYIAIHASVAASAPASAADASAQPVVSVQTDSRAARRHRATGARLRHRRGVRIESHDDQSAVRRAYCANARAVRANGDARHAAVRRAGRPGRRPRRDPGEKRGDARPRRAGAHAVAVRQGARHAVATRERPQGLDDAQQALRGAEPDRRRERQQDR